MIDAYIWRDKVSGRWQVWQIMDDFTDVLHSEHATVDEARDAALELIVPR